MLELTPFSRVEFRDSYEPTDDPVERARRLVARSFMAFGTTGRRKNATGFRAKAYRQNQTGPQDFATHPATLLAVIARLRGVTIECAPALHVMGQQDSPNTLHYVDPPYVHDTRTNWAERPHDRAYAHEMSNADHLELLEALKRLSGMVVLSAYPHALYDDVLLPVGWNRTEKKALADGARERTEVLWINPACRAAFLRDQIQSGLFDNARAAAE